jgi:hypothetical protein
VVDCWRSLRELGLEPGEALLLCRRRSSSILPLCSVGVFGSLCCMSGEVLSNANGKSFVAIGCDHEQDEQFQRR